MSDTATLKECKHCGAREGETGDRGGAVDFHALIDVCGTCDRGRHRLGGLTECCNAMPVARRQGGAPALRYCPACPGAGKVRVILIAPDGQERDTWHPRAAVLPHAKRRSTAPDSLVLRSSDARAWRLGTLSVKVYVQPKTRRTITCEVCGKRVSRTATAQSRRFVKTCVVCLPEWRRRQREASTKRWAARQVLQECPTCNRQRRYLQMGRWCQVCANRAKVNGECRTCMRPRSRTRDGRRFCAGCDPQSRRSGEQALVTLTDGEGFAQVKVSACHYLGGRYAAGWLAPLVLVDVLPTPGVRMRLRGAVVIGGICVPQGARLAIRALLEGVDLVEAFGSKGAAGQLRRKLAAAGLLDGNGLTDRARAVVRWAQAAGVNL